MKIKNVQIDGTTLKYKIRKNVLARRVKISINREGEVFLTVPRFIPERMAESFMLAKSDWIIAKVKQIKDANGFKNLLRYPPYKTSRKEALAVLKKKVSEVNEFYKFKFNKIIIKNQKTCWGSCSHRGNLNFSYRLAYMPDKFAEYVVAHELCHLKEMNHSKRFWDLLALRVPDYKQIHKEMRLKGTDL